MSQPPFVNPEVVGGKPARRTSGKAVTSLVLGVLSFMCAFVTGIPAIIFGILALGNIGKRPQQLSGQGLAIAGIATGAIGCLWSLILVALLLPAVQQVREAAKRTHVQNNLKQLALGCLNYESVHRTFPSPTPGPESDSQLNWRVQLLPYLEHMELYDQFHHDEPWDSPHNLTLVERMPEVFKSPGYDLEPGKTMYVAPVTRVDETGNPESNLRTAWVPGKQGKIFEKLDGTSNTILCMEVDPDAAVTWTKPEDWEFDPENPKRSLGGMHQGLLLVVLCDGSTHLIPIERIPDESLRRLFWANDGKVIEFIY